MPDEMSVEDFYGEVPFPTLNAADRSQPDGTSILDSPVSSIVQGILPKDSGVFNAISAAAEKYGVPSQFAFALANQESGYNPDAVGPETQWGTAKGMFQYLDTTASNLGINPLDYAQAADAAMKQFSERMKSKGIDWAIAAHFAGDDPKLHGRKTRQYIADVSKRASDIQELLSQGKVPTAANLKKQAAQKNPNILSVEDFYKQTTAEDIQQKIPDPPPTVEDEPWYQPAVDAAENTFEAAMHKVKQVIPALRTDQEKEDAIRGIGETTPVAFQYPDGRIERGMMSAEPAVDRRLRWQQIVNEDPSRIKDVPKDLLLDIAHNSEQVRGFVKNLKNPLELFTQESMPANIVSFYANLPERARKRFDEARQVAMQDNIVAHPEKFPAVAVEAAQQAIDRRKQKQDPNIRQQWDAIKQAATEDPGRFGAELVNSLMADPEMLFAPIGLGTKVASATKAAITGVEKTGKIVKIADRVIDAGGTAGALNAAIEAAHGLANTGTVSGKDVALSTALGVAIGGPLGIFFRHGAEARAAIADPAKAKLNGVYDDALREAAAADVKIENDIREMSPESFAQAPAVRKLLGLDEDWDSEKFIQAYRRQVKAAFKDNQSYADYLSFKAEERVAAATAKAEAATQAKAAGEQAALKDITTDAAYDSQRAARQAEWRDNFDRAVESRDASELERVMQEASAENADRLYIQKLDADDAMEAAFTRDVPQIKRMLGKAAKRDRLLNMPKGQRGEIDPRLMKAAGISVAGAAVGASMFPNDPKKGALAGAILSPLIVAGLRGARGSEAGGVKRLVSQQGAIKPKGGNWDGRSADSLRPTAVETEGHTLKVTERYLNRYAGTVDDPLKDIVLPDGTRWEDAMDMAIKKGPKDSYGGDTWKFTPLGINHDAARAMEKIRSYMDHVGDYLRTLPESEVKKMDFVRMVKETKRWDEANARKMENATVKHFKDAEVFREYPDGMKWIRLNKPGQFANESDLMGHSVRGYEPSKNLNYGTLSDVAFNALDVIQKRYDDIPIEDIPLKELPKYLKDLGDDFPDFRQEYTNWLAKYDSTLDWVPESVGGYQDYGYGGWSAIKNDDARIYSLRKADGKPVATVELGRVEPGNVGGDRSLWNVAQARGPRNEDIKTEYVPKVKDLFKELQSKEGSITVEDDVRMGLGESFDDVVKNPWNPEAGKADPRLMARLAAVGAGGTLAYALAPEDEKVATGLAGALAGLLIPAGGTVLSRLRQSGSVSLDGGLSAAPFRRIKNGLSAEEDAAARITELKVVDRAKAGDQAAMKEIYTKYFPYIKRVTANFLRDAGPRLAMDAEDIAQDTMIKVFSSLDSFKGESEFSTWVHAIGKNTALNAITKSKSRPLTEGMESTLRFKDNDMAELGELPTKVEETNPSTYDTPENMAILEDTQNQLQHAFQKMPEEIRLAMILRDFEGFNTQEIADKLGIPLGTAKSRLNRGEGMIKEALEKGWGAKRGAPKNQRGDVDPKLLKAGAGATLGGLAGAYFANRSDGSVEGGAAAGAIIGAALAGNAGALPRLIKHIYGSTATSILEKAPPIYRRIMTMERRVLTDTHKNIEAGVPFFKALRKLAQPDQDVVARALMTGDANVIQKVLKAAGNVELIRAYAPLRAALDNLGSQLEARNLIRRTGIEYFPRMVIDKEGLFKAISKDDKSRIEVALLHENAESIRKQGRTLNAIEESALINKILFTDKNKSRPGWSRNRGIEEITPELQPFYASPVESFNTYVRSAVEEIEKAKFFGKYAIKDKAGKLEYINTDTSASKMMADWIKDGRLSPEDAHELAGMIKSRFGGGTRGEPAIVRDAKSLGNMGLLGNFWSAVTQLGDVGGIIYTQGFRPTIETLVRRATGRKYVDMKDFGLADHISEEFANQGKLARWTNRVFKLSLFSGVDKTGKTIALNAALQKAKNLVSSDTGEVAFRKRYSAVFGDDINGLVQDIKKGNFTSELAQDYAFMELERFQPITRTSFPQFYLDHPNFRSYLWLQSWTMKQFDILRRDGLGEMKKGNVAKGIASLTKAALVMGSANAGMQSIRDYLLGKDVNLDWGSLALNMFRNYGWSEYESRRFLGVTKEEAKEARKAGDKRARAQKAEPVTTIAKRVVPPYQAFEQAFQGNPRAVARMVPFVGPYLAEKFKKAQEFEQDMKRRHPDRSR